MEFNFDNINCGSSSASAGSGVVTASNLLSLPSYSLLSQELLHLQQQQSAATTAPYQHQQLQQQTPQLIFSTTPQLQQCLQQQQQDLQHAPLDQVQVEDQHQQLQSQIPNFGDYILPDDNVSDFMNGGATDDGHSHNNHDELHDESISLLLMPPQSPTVIKTELDKIEETIKEVGSGAYFHGQDQEAAQAQQEHFQTLADLQLQSVQSQILENGGASQSHQNPLSLQTSELNATTATTSLVNNTGSNADSYPNLLSSAPAPSTQVQEQALQIRATAGVANSGCSESVPVNDSATSNTKNCMSTKLSTTVSTNGSEAAAVTNSNHIGSRNSAFMPYKVGHVNLCKIQMELTC